MKKLYKFEINGPQNLEDIKFLDKYKTSKRALTTFYYDRNNLLRYSLRGGITKYNFSISTKFKESTLNYLSIVGIPNAVKVEKNKTFIPLEWPMDIVWFLLLMDEYGLAFGTPENNMAAIESIKDLSIPAYNKLYLLQYFLNFLPRNNSGFKTKIKRKFFDVSTPNPNLNWKFDQFKKEKIIRDLKQSLVYELGSYRKFHSGAPSVGRSFAKTTINILIEELDLEREPQRVQDMYYILLGTVG